MTTIEKINALNEACRGTLTFSCFGHWETNSYGEGTPLNKDQKYPYLKSASFEDLVDKAYQYVFSGGEDE